jgi:hypothetical protein
MAKSVKLDSLLNVIKRVYKSNAECALHNELNQVVMRYTKKMIFKSL